MGPTTGLPPTLADVHAQGITHLFIRCDNPACYSAQRRVALADLYVPPGRRPLPDTAVFADLPNLCRFRCIKCNGRSVSVMADWPSTGGTGGMSHNHRPLPRTKEDDV